MIPIWYILRVAFPADYAAAWFFFHNARALSVTYVR